MSSHRLQIKRKLKVLPEKKHICIILFIDFVSNSGMKVKVFIKFSHCSEVKKYYSVAVVKNYKMMKHLQTKAFEKFKCFIT